MGKRSFWSSGAKTDAAERSYRDLFDNGACIYPRCSWFVDLRTSELGYDRNLLPSTSSERARKEAKAAYKGCAIQGMVESRFMYAVLLPADMVPFGALRFRPVILPALTGEGGPDLLRPGDAHRQGYIHLARWLEQVEAEWTKRRSGKLRDINAIAWLD
jgi:hypothetical protein